MAGISAVGFALPRLALKADEAKKATGAWNARGVVEKTVAEYDEDEVTLAVDAAKAAMGGINPGHLGYLGFASVGAPAGSAALASAALQAHNAQPAEFRGGGPPFAAALHAAIQLVESTEETALVVAADALRAAPEDGADHALGAGAAAFVIEKLAPVQFVGWSFMSLPSLEPSRVGQDGLVRAPIGDDPAPSALRLALTSLFTSGATEPHDRGLTGFPPDSFDRVAGPERAWGNIRAHLPPSFDPERFAPSFYARTGDTGAASAALSLAAALEVCQAEDQVLIADAEGASGAAFAAKVAERPRGAFHLRTLVETQRTHLSWQAYLGHRRYLPSPAPTHTKSEGAYVSASSWEETLEARLTLMASRCASCNAAHHPPREACPDCDAGAVVQKFHARPTGAVHAVTRIGRGGAPSEYALQQSSVGEYGVAIIDLVDGFRMVAQLSSCDPRTVKIGDGVSLRLRRLFEQEGRVRYGLKAVPLGPEHRPP